MYRYIILALLISFQANLSHAVDFGSFLKKSPFKKDQTAKDVKDQGSAQPARSDLVGMVKGAPVEEEIAIGREIAGRLLGAAPLVKDKDLQLYVYKVGKWLALQSGRKDLEWHFGVIESDDINAFAAPGGYIFITKGLYKELNSEAELAGVLAHEIGHVIKKHHLNLLKKSKGISMGINLLRSSVEGNEGEQYIKKLIGNGAEIMARSLDKEAEFEADRIGVVVATRGGYDSYGLPSVLQEIGHISANDSSVSLLFKTHPHPNTRLTKLENAMGDKFDKYANGKLVSERFYRIKD
jgi:predicted Zn-dependent protease